MPSGGRAVTEIGGVFREGWQTPNTMTGGSVSRGHNRKDELLLAGQAKAAGWQTPKLPSGGACNRNTPGGGLRKLEDHAELFCMMPHMTGWKLNPLFSLWLMGYPVEWACCEGLATRLCRKWRQNLSELSLDNAAD